MRALTVAVMLVLAVVDATAATSRLYVDDVSVEPSVLGGYARITIDARAMTLDGHRITSGTWSVEIGGHAVPSFVADAPSGQPVRIVFVIERGAAYEKALGAFAARA